MSNPVLSNNAIFGEPRRTGRGTATRESAAVDTAAGLGAAAPRTLEELYSAPAATTRDTARMTYDDVIVRTAGLLVLLAAVGVATFALAPQLWPVGMVVGLVLGLVNSFKKEPSPALIVAYTVAEGVFLGGISLAFQNMTFDGTSVQPIIVQAVLATVVTFGAALALYASGKVRVTPKFTRWLMIALVGYLGYSLVNFALSFFMASDGFGPLRNGWLGIGVGLFAVGLAAASLIMDFDAIKRGVERGAPARFAWTAAFGLIVTLVWLYLELLRLLSMLNRN